MLASKLITVKIQLWVLMQSIIIHHAVNWWNCQHYILSIEYNIVSPQLSIFRQPNFVITCFIIKYLNISTSICFSIKQHIGMIIILPMVVFVKCKQFVKYCLWMFLPHFSHQFFHQKCLCRNQRVTYRKHLFAQYLYRCLPFVLPSKPIGKHWYRKYFKCHNLF